VKLRISKDLSLPVETVTESIALLAKRGAGKTYAASVLVEEMLKAKLQVVVLDPMNAWWGLRSSADGKGEGFPIAILGGPRGDVPLEPTGGTLVADLIVDERLSAILDLSPFSKNERRRFVADFLERLFSKNTDAMHVVLEEADLFAPEGKLKRAGDEAMLGAVYDLVRRGRGRGIGSTLITQRSASLSKEVLTQAEILIALRTTGPQDVAAIREWIRYHGSDEERELVLSGLHELPTGEAFAWWPVEGILKRIKIRQRETFDSSATPRPGQAKQEPKTVADVDLEALSERMASTIEKAKADDPRELRSQLADRDRKLSELQRRLDGAEASVTHLEAATADADGRVDTVIEKIELPVLLETDLARLAELVETLGRIAGDVQTIADALTAAVSRAASEIAARVEEANALVGSASRRPRAEQGERKRAESAVKPSGPVSGRAPARRPAPPAAEANGGFRSTGPQQRVLDALAWLEAVGFPQPTKIQVGFIAGYRVGKRVGGTFGNILGELRSAGLLEYPAAGTVELTHAGRTLAEVPDIERTTRGLQKAVYARLDGPERRVLQVLVAAYPEALSKQETGELAGYTVGDRVGGTFGNILGRLRSLGLIDYPSPGQAAALPVLFLEAARA
jgi:hypothetical protein